MISRLSTSVLRTFGSVFLIGALGACTNIKNDSDRTRAEGAATGAVAGAAVGAGTAALLKKGNGNAVVAGTAIGAVAGGLAGAAVGDSVAKKKEGYAQKESALDSQLAGLTRQIEARKGYNNNLRNFIDSKEGQLKTVLASDRSAGPTVQEFDFRTSVNSRIGEVDRESRSWQETIDAHKAVLSKASADPRAGELQAQIDQLAEQRAELLRQRVRLSALTGKLTPASVPAPSPSSAPAQ